MIDLETRIIREAETWLGTPYRHQAACRQVGADCLGFIYGLYAHLYPQDIPVLPAYGVAPQTGEGERLWRGACDYLQECPDRLAMPGNVLLFRLRCGYPARHLAVLLTDAAMAHAVNGRGVVKSRYGPWWRRRLVTVFAFPQSSKVPHPSKTPKTSNIFPKPKT